MMKNGIRFKQRSIILVPFPFSDLSNNKKRPALVVSNNEFNESNEDMICCLITSNPRPFKHSVNLNNNDLESGFLNFESKVKPHRLFTISQKIVLKQIAMIKKNKHLSIEKEINNLISLE